jgi:uncharacterized protein YkwD
MLRALVALIFVVPIAACGADDDDGGGGDPPPGVAYCDPTRDWMAEWEGNEVEVLALVNAERARGASCAGTSMPPQPAVTMDAALVCAARVHSWDMSTQGYFDHTGLDGSSPWDRFEKAGYTWSAAGENIAVGQGSPAEVMQSWMASTSGHCDSIMSGDFTQIGVGFYPNGGPYWTMTLARP